MSSYHRRVAMSMMIAAALAGCGRRDDAGDESSVSSSNFQPGETPQMRALIRKYAKAHDIPESLLRRVVKRESGFNPAARNGPYYGLMQIRHETARTMGYRGPAEGLLDAETNLHYAGKYLRGAWIVANGSEDRAIRWYSNGYYYEAKRRGLLEETGLRG